jgi:hypothetical protein
MRRSSAASALFEQINRSSAFDAWSQEKLGPCAMVGWDPKKERRASAPTAKA